MILAWPAKRHMGNLFSNFAKFYTEISVIAHFPGSCRDTHAVKDVEPFQLRKSAEKTDIWLVAGRDIEVILESVIE